MADYKEWLEQLDRTAYHDGEWQWQEGDFTVTRTTHWSPPGCHGMGCGVRAYVKDGKCVKIEGDVDDPITKGRLCVRCLRVLDLIYHPDRIVASHVPRPGRPRQGRRLEEGHVGLGVRQDRGRNQEVQGKVRPEQPDRAHRHGS